MTHDRISLTKNDFYVDFTKLVCEFCPEIESFQASRDKYLHFKKKHSLYLSYYCVTCKMPFKNIVHRHAVRHGGQIWLNTVYKNFNDIINNINSENCIQSKRGNTVIFEPVNNAKNEKVCIACREKFTDTEMFRKHINICIFKEGVTSKGGNKPNLSEKNDQQPSTSKDMVDNTGISCKVSNIMNFGKKIVISDSKQDNDLVNFQQNVREKTISFLKQQLKIHKSLKSYSEFLILYKKVLFHDSEDQSEDIEHVKSRSLNSGLKFLNSEQDIVDFVDFHEENAIERSGNFQNEASGYNIMDISALNVMVFPNEVLNAGKYTGIPLKLQKLLKFRKNNIFICPLNTESEKCVLMCISLLLQEFEFCEKNHINFFQG